MNKVVNNKRVTKNYTFEFLKVVSMVAAYKGQKIVDPVAFISEVDCAMFFGLSQIAM